MYTVYAIHNQDHDKIYIGQTQDIEKRLKMHNDHTLGGFTSKFSGKWVLIYKELAPNRKKALEREKQLKTFRGRESIRRNIPR